VLQSDLEGTYTGIGVVISKTGDQIVIQTVFPNTPAAKAGLKAGDIIMAVDGKVWSKFQWTLFLPWLEECGYFCHTGNSA